MWIILHPRCRFARLYRRADGSILASDPGTRMRPLRFMFHAPGVRSRPAADSPQKIAATLEENKGRRRKDLCSLNRYSPVGQSASGLTLLRVVALLQPD